AAALEISGDIITAGPSVNFAVSKDLDDSVVEAFTLSIPFDVSLSLINANLLVFFHVKKSDGKFYYGLIPLADITVDDSLLKFKARGFGNYRAVITSSLQRISATKETTASVAKKAEETTPARSCSDDSGITVSGSTACWF